MSNNLNLDQVTAAQNQKEVTINDQAGQIDAALTEVFSIDLSSGDAIVSQAQFTRAIQFICNGNTVARVITIPATKRLFAFQNGGSEDVTITVSGGSSVVVAAAGTAILYTNGTTPTIIASVAGSSGIPDAPADGLLYGRKDNAWEAGVEEAPSDGVARVRKDAAWEQLVIAAPVGTAITASTTLVLAQANQYLRSTAGSPITVTVPTNASVAYPLGTEVHIRQAGAGQVTLAGDTGVTLNAPFEGTLLLAGEGATVTLKKVGADEWDVFGLVEAA